MLKSQVLMLGLILSGALAVGPAIAADIDRPAGPLKAVPYVSTADWNGFYFGANAGFGWSASNTPIIYNATAGGSGMDNFPAFQPKGGFGGGQIGYNWRRRHFVFGAEADFQGSGISDNFSGLSASGSRQIASRDNLDWFGTARGRAGYAFDNLVYFTGDLAYGQINQRVDIIPFPGTSGAFVQRDDVRTGFVVGGGIEYALNSAWSVKGEYQFIDLGSQNLTGFNTTTFLSRFTNDLDNNFHTLRIGVNYRFGAQPSR
jgi:outer membrane immunogenic protein